MEKYGVKNALELVNPDNQTPWFTTEKGKEYLENRPPLTEDKKQQIWYSRMLNSGIVKDPVLIDIISSKNSVRFKDYIDNLATTITEPDRISLSKKLGFSVSWLNMLFRRHGMQEDYNSAGYYGSSAGEKEVKRFIRELGFEVNSSNRGVLGSGFEIDILVKEKNLAIEYNGVIWHSEGKTGRDKSYHLKKTDRCEELGIQLLHIYDVEWNDILKQDIWKSIIRNKLGCTQNKIYARKCTTKQITSKESREFLNKNHLNGFVGAEIHHGLFYDDLLVSVISFGKSRFMDEYEVIRHASLLNTVVVGGLSKLLSLYNKKEKLVSYADRRFSSLLNTKYDTLSKSYNITSPSWYGYKYSEYELKHRLSFTKHKLKEMFDYNEELSAFDNMLANGYDRIWDSGTIKYYIT